MVNKSMTIATLFITTLALFGGMSVVGLLQSSERFGSSGIVIKPPPQLPSPPPSPGGTSPTSPPPEPTIEIDVYSNQACTQSISSVSWGSIEAGSSVDRVIYVKNSGDYRVFLELITDDWAPSGAVDFIHLSWDSDGIYLDPSAVLEATLTLNIDSSIDGIDSFNFDIILIGSAS